MKLKAEEKLEIATLSDGVFLKDKFFLFQVVLTF